VIIADDRYKSAALRKDGNLGDIAPTLLKMMGLKVPKEMDGKPLI
jgi:bisphosphoglycerate-independent phosphoglycerate mutase (AlkP superfamily)